MPIHVSKLRPHVYPVPWVCRALRYTPFTSLSLYPYAELFYIWTCDLWWTVDLFEFMCEWHSDSLEPPDKNRWLAAITEKPVKLFREIFLSIRIWDVMQIMITHSLLVIYLTTAVAHKKVVLNQKCVQRQRGRLTYKKKPNSGTC